MTDSDYKITEEETKKFKERGYNEDLIPKSDKQRNMSMKNYFTLWMGSVHNIPNYTAVGGFLFLGISPVNVMLAIVVSSVVVSTFMIFNGRAGSKYGIPFAMQLRSAYGNLGAKLPGFLRGCVAAIAWFGLQTYTGSLALLVIMGKIWPGFLDIGETFDFFGISAPGLIAFAIFWVLNVLIGFGGGDILNKFTGILSPLIYVVIIAMMIWAVNAAGGLGPILSYDISAASESVHPVLAYFMIANSILGVWAAPGSSVSDFTQRAKSTKDQMIGQTLSLVTSYILFAFSSVIILIGGSISFGIEEWNIVNIINRWDNLPAVIIATGVFLMTTISTNATGNIIPAAYQLTALFPKKINYRRGVIIASVISFIIMPWKLMENSDSIFIFLNFIGAVLGPLAGVMITDFFIVHKQRIDLNQLYMETKGKGDKNQYRGVNKAAYIATILGLLISFSGQFIPSISVISDISWLVGFVAAGVIYLLLKKLGPTKMAMPKEEN